MKKVLFAVVVLAAFSVSACTREVPELKSPCVGAEKSPCGPRIPVNDQWLKKLGVKV